MTDDRLTAFMDPTLFSTNTVLPLLMSAGLLLAAFIPSLLVYGYLADRVQFGGHGKVSREGFGGWNVPLAAGITLFFGLIIVLGASGASPDSGGQSSSLPGIKLIVLAAIQTEILFLSLVAGILVVLQTGGHSWKKSLGMEVYPAAIPIIGRAVLLLLLAYPLIGVSLQVWRLVIASAGYLDNSQQDSVRLLAESKSMAARLVVAVQAVIFAPAQEEIIFRGFLYGVAKRYFGVSAGILLTSALFAGIHNHLPSFAGLFMLAVCLNLAYEWTGSLFVPIAMHAMFNLLSVVVLFRAPG